MWLRSALCFLTLLEGNHLVLGQGLNVCANKQVHVNEAYNGYLNSVTDEDMLDASNQSGA